MSIIKIESEARCIDNIGPLTKRQPKIMYFQFVHKHRVSNERLGESPSLGVHKHQVSNVIRQCVPVGRDNAAKCPITNVVWIVVILI